MNAAIKSPEGDAERDSLDREIHSSRTSGLDLVRATACAMVVLCHFSEYQGDSSLVWLKNGVLLFFALSGYLLYRPFTKGKVDLRRYAVHRLARILPAYLIALVGLSVISGSTSFLDHPLTYLLFLQNFDHSLWQGFAGVTWTLALEVAFYLTLPALARLVERSLARVVLLGLASWAGAVVVYSVAPAGWDNWASSLYPFMIWAFAPGMAVALIEDRLPKSWAILGLGVALIATASFHGQWSSIDLPSGIGSGLVVAWAVGARPSFGRLGPLISVGAALTYSVYLWHVDVIKLILGPLAIVVALGIATFIYVTAERPILRWAKTRFRQPAPPTAALVANR